MSSLDADLRSTTQVARLHVGLMQGIEHLPHPMRLSHPAITTAFSGTAPVREVALRVGRSRLRRAS
jgi:hypothetical protein